VPNALAAHRATAPDRRPSARLSDLVDVWEAVNRDDLFAVTSLKHYRDVANGDFHKRKHL
jgi:hypothetical protein